MVGVTTAFLTVIVCVCVLECCLRKRCKEYRKASMPKEGDDTDMTGNALTTLVPYTRRRGATRDKPDGIQLPGPGAHVSKIPSISSMTTSLNKRISATESSKSNADDMNILNSIHGTIPHMMGMHRKLYQRPPV